MAGLPVAHCFHCIFQVIVILIDVSTFTVLHPSLPSLHCTQSGSYFLTEQQLADMKIAEMQALLTNARQGRSTQPTDTGATHAFFALPYLRHRF
jgi:hypothetical protein